MTFLLQHGHRERAVFVQERRGRGFRLTEKRIVQNPPQDQRGAAHHARVELERLDFDLHPVPRGL